MSKKVKIKISPDRYRKVKVLARVGCLAIHRSINNEQALTVTYVKTGLAVCEISAAIPVKAMKWILKELGTACENYDRAQRARDEAKRLEWQAVAHWLINTLKSLNEASSCLERVNRPSALNRADENDK